MGTFQDEATRQLWSLINLHNTLLTVVYVEWLAQFPADEAAEIAKRIMTNLAAISVPPGTDPADVDGEALMMFRDAQVFGARFFDRALALAAERRS